MSLLLQSTSRVVMLKLFLSSDHVSAATSKTLAITISKAGGAFGNPNAGATNATEVSSGWYKVTLDTTDTNTLGDLVVRGTSASCDDCERALTVQATPLTAAQIAAGVWQDTTAGDFTTASSIGKSLYNAFTANTSVFTSASLVNAPAAPTAATIATAVENQIMDETDGRAVLNAIVAKINSVDADLSGLSISAIAAASATATATQITTDHGSGAYNVTAVTVSDKTGFKLASDGLDSISVTPASGQASNFRQMIVAVWRRLYGKATVTSSALKTYAADGTTLVTTQTLSDDGTTQTQGEAA